MIKLSRILHAGYVFECQGAKILFDPIFENPFSRNCYAFPDVRFDLDLLRRSKFEAVFISHFHDDHCSLESLDLLDRGTPIYIYCVHQELFSWVRELGFEKVHSLDLNFPVQVDQITVTPLRALDADLDSLFHIRAQNLNILNVVDSWIDEDMMTKLAKIAPWDLVLWPFQTMRELEVLSPTRAASSSDSEAISIPQEWIEQLKMLKPKFLVPSS